MNPRTHRTHDREKELAAIYQAGLAVASTLDLQKVLHSTVQTAARLLGADVVTLYLYDQTKAEFVPPVVAVGVSRTFKKRGMPSLDGSAAKIAKTGKPLIADEAQRHPDISRGFIKAERIVSSAGFPLKVGGIVVGVLFLNYHAHHKFTADDIEHVAIFANQAAIAIRNAELFRQQEATAKRLQLQQEAKRAIDSATELQNVLDRILSEGLQIVNTNRGSLMLIDGDQLCIKSQSGPETGDPERESIKSFRIGEGIAGIVASTGEAVLCTDVLQDIRFKPPLGKKPLRFRSLLAVPIVSHEDRVIGVISADDPEVGHFNETHKQLLSDMAGQFATAIERMMLVNTLRALHEIFSRITSVAISSRDPQPVLEEIARNAVEILKIDIITIYQYSQERHKFIVPPLMKGINQSQRMQTEVFEGEAPWVLVRQLQQHYYAPDAKSDPYMNPPRPEGKGKGFVDREGICSSASLLLRVGKEIVGVMFVNYRSFHHFEDAEKLILETFANSAAIAIQDVRQWDNLKRTQEQLIQSAKMSAVGTLASGIAHELKNPLSNILSSVNVLEISLQDESCDQLRAQIEQIKEEVDRSRKIVDSLLGFVRPPEAILEPSDVLAIVNEALNLLVSQARLNHIDIETELNRVPLIEGNPALLKQVFFNIIRNAIEAMPHGGRLSVRLLVDHQHIRVLIQDTGPGIPPEIQDHIFDPFFTTKETGQGMGLGLAISSKIIQDHGGEIKLESQIGKGTVFVISLPRGE